MAYEVWHRRPSAYRPPPGANYFRSASNGHWSARYFSAASRTIQASETLFAAASFSSSLYTSGGKLIDARLFFRGWLAFFPAGCI